jgi:putative lipoprotein
LEAVLEDVWRTDAPAETIAQTRIASPGNPPIAFTIAYEPTKILADHCYVVRARILLAEKFLFTTDTATPLITRGSPTRVSIMLRGVTAGQTPATRSLQTQEPWKGGIGGRSSWRKANAHAGSEA